MRREGGVDEDRERLCRLLLQGLEDGRYLVRQTHGDVDACHRGPVDGRPVADAVRVEVVAADGPSELGEVRADVAADGSEPDDEVHGALLGA